MKKTIVAVAIGVVIVAMIITFGQVFTVRYVNVNFENAVASTNKEEILSVADIDANTNIFILDEKDLKKRIENNFDDNAISVSNVVRKFPSTVTIHVYERIPLFKIRAKNASDDGYVWADRNFQRTNVYGVDFDLVTPIITVNNVLITTSYNTAECRALKDLADAMMKIGFKEEAIPYFIESVSFDGNDLVLLLRADGARFEIANYTENLKSKFASLYLKYSEANPKDRNNQTFSE